MDYSLRAYAVADQLLPGWACFFGKNDATLHRIAFYVWVVQGGGKTVVIDAGPPPDECNFQVLADACGSLDSRSKLRRLQTLETVFSNAGITPDSVDILLLTQPITYNTGGMLPAFFPRAIIYLARAAVLEFMLDNPGHPPRNCYFTEDTWRFIHDLLISNRLFLSENRIQVLPDLWLEITGGHHPGSAAVMMKTARGLTAILETAFLAENVEQERPIGIAEDAAACRRVIRRYRNSCNLVLAAHDGTINDLFPEGVVA